METRMTDGKYQPLTDSTDDLPRTFRRERENRERAAREQQARMQMPQTDWDRGQVPATQSDFGAPEPANPYGGERTHDDAAGGIVRGIKMPFFSLMGFFIKAVFAAIPALLILIAMFYAFGIALQTYFPQLIKMKIMITFPG
jgi:hypothetical protein